MTALPARIWVAGHRGMVGAALVRRLTGAAEVLTVDKAALDLRDGPAVRAWLTAHRPDAVILAAARVGGIGANAARPADFIAENLAIQQAVIGGSAAAGIERLLFLGSSCIYPRAAPQPIPEEALLTGPLEPTNAPYAVAKIAGITLCQALRRQHGLRYISAQPTNLYGPGDNYDPDGSHVLAALLRKAHRARAGGPLEVWGTGRPLREFLHADDCADALVHLLAQYDGELPINIGSGEEVSIARLAEMCLEVAGAPGPPVFDPSRPDGTPRKLLDCRRLAALGWSAARPLAQGLAETYAAAKNMLD